MTKRPTQLNIDLDEPRYRGEKKKRFESLVQLRDQLIESVTMLSSESLKAEHSAGEDNADIGSDNFLREMGLSVATEEGRKIFLIQDALVALENGSYGKCIDCNVSIESGRLDALPYAKLCVACKTVREESEDGDYVGFGIEKEDVTE
jgi:DnaK suppressor protein